MTSAPDLFSGGVTRLLAGLARGAASLLAPAWCRRCGSSLWGMHNPYLCPACLADIEWIAGPTCKTCGYPAGPFGEPVDACRHCRGANPPLTGTVAVARYSFGAKHLVTALKFRRETELVAPLAALMDARRRLARLPECDVALPVPLHSARKRQRGFNQAALLARAVAGRAGMEVGEKVLVKCRNTAPQSTLRRDERLAHGKDAYRVGADLSGKRVLLVDDVMTTGATLGECAKVCRAAGAVRVYALVFAR